MTAYFKWECREFFTNRKNLAIYLLLLFFSLFYWIQIDNNYQAIETVSKEKLQASVDTKDDFLANVNLEGETHPDTLGAVALFTPLVENEHAQLNALEKKDYRELAKIRSEWYYFGTDFSPLYFKDGNIYASEEGFYERMATSHKLLGYSEGKREIDLSLINEKTAAHALVRALNYLLPVMFIILGLVFSMDMIAKDRGHKSLLKGMPLSDGKKIMVKFLVASLGVFVSLIPLSVGFIGIGLSNGFGHLNIPIPVSYYKEHMPLITDLMFKNIHLGTYLLQAFILITLLVAVAICINLILGIWIKNAYFLLILTVSLPFLELLYNRFGYGDIHTITYFPTSYVRVGDVLTGHKGFFWADVNLNFQSGVMTVSVCLLVLVIILALHSRFKKLL
ncbi:hypothetical protein [Vagococcus fluvialis]|uniref:hypothetical protein n=1 Tax=Vagococcus fluvialis TaxID=2738 RepID=UPI001A904B33|nr:hypothetical protein [Vagococcus fluvialis]MBO0444395.1 hypothetical protein [Vagococcus fluvialis]MDT2747500.1 hypothetical protein [Vagococcus fluvialis]UDM73369.1 hypothetical protein K5K99_10590 [Vagococcus fluvialis]WNF88911.1 hypothetical protein QDW48_06945 [Vagococcus fluvialis]